MGNKAGVAEEFAAPQQIAAQAVHGLPIKAQVKLVKFVPHNIVMKTWMNQQKKAKNNKGLTSK